MHEETPLKEPKQPLPPLFDCLAMLVKFPPPGKPDEDGSIQINKDSDWLYKLDGDTYTFTAPSSPKYSFQYETSNPLVLNILQDNEVTATLSVSDWNTILDAEKTPFSHISPIESAAQQQLEYTLVVGHIHSLEQALQWYVEDLNQE